MILNVEHLPTVLKIILQLSSIRRMIFDTSERFRYINMLITGLTGILVNGERLNDPVRKKNLFLLDV